MPTDTPRNERFATRNPQVAPWVQAMRAHCRGRSGRAEEVAAAVTFLGTAQAGLIDGFELVVEGGLTHAGWATLSPRD